MSQSGGIAKVLVVGNVATGKTSVINRFVRNKFSKDYQTTIGVDFSLKRVKVAGQELNVQLWDIAGQDRFAGLSRIFYTHAVAAIIVYDIFSKVTFDSVIKWKKDMDSKVFLPSGANIPVLLLGNKSDLLETGQPPQVSEEDVRQLMAETPFFAHYRCSAKSGENIKEACTELISKIAENNQSEQAAAAHQQQIEQQQNTKPNVSLGPSTPKLGGGGGGGASASQNAGGGGCCG